MDEQWLVIMYEFVSGVKVAHFALVPKERFLGPYTYNPKEFPFITAACGRQFPYRSWEVLSSFPVDTPGTIWCGPCTGEEASSWS